MQNILNPELESLTRIRFAYTLVALRATRVRAVLEHLETRELWLNYASAREAIISESWSWVTHLFPKKADYAKKVDEQGLPDKLGEVETVRGIKVLKLRPFADRNFQLPPELGLEFLSRLGSTESRERVHNVEMPSFRDGEESLCDWEMTILKKAIHRRTLELVNAMRDIEGSVRYLLSLRQTGMRREAPVAIVAEAKDVDATLYRLLDEVTLGFQPEPPSYPSHAAEQLLKLPGVPASVFSLETRDVIVSEV